MRYITKTACWYQTLLILSVGLLFLAACASDEGSPAGNNPPPAAEDEELQVVVFETQAPTDTPVATAVSQPQATDTPGATVGGGATSAESQETPVTDDVVLVSSDGDATGRTNPDFSRPSDINPLTGLKVDDPAVLERRPLMVRIGNDPGARPQVGLNQADIVYEEIAEWWVTRFTAIFLSQDPDTIGPIRSARLINLQLIPQYQGALANSGGSDGVRWEISQTSILNLDEFFVPKPYFYRPNEGWQTRLAFDAIAGRDYLADEDLESDVNLRGFIFDPAPDFNSLPSAAVQDANEITIPYPQQTALARWTYDAATERYLRFTTGDPAVDADGVQVSASNVIVYFADHQDTDIVEDSNGATSIRIIINGRGAAWLFRNGKLLKGNWETNGTTPPNFIFDDGQAMPLKPGNTWVQVVPLAYKINIDGTDQDSLGATPIETTTDIAEEEETEAEPSPTLTPIGARAAEATAEPSN